MLRSGFRSVHSSCMNCMPHCISMLVHKTDGFHQSATKASKRATKQKLKALFNWEAFVKHDQLGLSDVSFELFLVQIVFKKQ